jgi:uncharacterized membrane protein
MGVDPDMVPAGPVCSLELVCSLDPCQPPRLRPLMRHAPRSGSGGEMVWLVIGLLWFTFGHAFTMAREARGALIGRLGENGYRIAYSVFSLIGLALIIHGYAAYRADGYIPVWMPPRWLTHVSLLLMWPSMILLVATFLPGEIRRRAKFPALAAVKLWAFAHLLANGDLGSILLFGTFLTWAVVARIAAKRRPQPEMPQGSTRNDLVAFIGGTGLYVLFAFVLHPILIGVPVVGG